MSAGSVDPLQAKCPHAVRSMTLADVDAVVDIHVTAMPEYFLSALGRNFLALYYAEVVRSKLGISFVVGGDGRVLGFVTGEFGPGKFYRELFLRRCFAFGFHGLRAVARRPSILARIIRALFQRFESSRRDDVARLASVAVLPEARGRGYGLALIAAFIEHVRERGGTAILLEVKKENPSLRVYQRMGFEAVGEIAKSPGETLVEMRYILSQPASGVEARGQA